MRVVLVQPPNGLFDVADLAPPLGLLALASALKNTVAQVSILDFNLEVLSKAISSDQDFYPEAVKRVLELSPDVLGFTSMALESHLCLKLAKLIKAVLPKVKIVLGGPHFSSVARETLQFFPFVDFVVLGEGEVALKQLVNQNFSPSPSSAISGIAYRENGDIKVNPAHSTTSLAFERIDYSYVPLARYFSTNPNRLLNFEHGRGCIYRCGFCYSQVHWGHGSRVGSVESIVQSLEELKSLNPGQIFFVQDNFLNHANFTLVLCKALAPLQLPPWLCYGTLPQLSDPIIDSLSAAGCKGIFLGIDAISVESKEKFSKAFFKNWDALKKKLKSCLDKGITPTCAFMVDFPLAGDHRATDQTLLIALLTRNLGCSIRLNTLSLYPGTDSWKEASAGINSVYCELKPKLMFDTLSILEANEFAKDHPELFPFHSVQKQISDDYEEFLLTVHAAFTLISAYPDTLLRLVLAGHSLWDIFTKVAFSSSQNGRPQRADECSAFKEFVRSTTNDDHFLTAA